MLARHAEAVYWMARYVERAENLARILDVQQIFANDLAATGKAMPSILHLNSDEPRSLSSATKSPDCASVTQFYVLDQDNPTSLISAIHSARENARALRPLISTEMWMQLNVFYRQLKALTPS